MNSKNILKLKCLLIIEAIFICLVNGIDMIVKTEKESEICFTFQNSTLNETLESPRVSLDLLVKYPMSIAEAGYVDLEQELTPGPHIVWYKYRVANMTHGLDVKLDGKKVGFIKPKIPRWYTVSHFHEVAVSFQGNIVEYKCSYNDSKKPNDILPILSGLQIFTSSTEKPLIKDEEIKETPSLSPVTSSKPENIKIKSESNVSTNETSFHNNITEQVNKRVNESIFNTEIKETNKLPLTTISVSVNKTVDEKEHASESPEQVTNLINISIEIPNATLDRQENLLPTILPDLNYSNFENGPPESSQSCLNGNCEEGQYSHNYIVAFCLFGILGAMVLIAIVISVVFHRKKKKLMISSRARPNNRLRQQIFEREIAAESQLMLRQMEHTYEELP